MKGEITITINITSEKNAQYYGKVLQNIADNVNEAQIKEIADELKNKSKMFAKLASNFKTLIKFL